MGRSSKDLRERPAYVGFLEGRVFQGRDFQGELVGFQVLLGFRAQGLWVQVVNLGFLRGRVELDHLCLEG